MSHATDETCFVCCWCGGCNVWHLWHCHLEGIKEHMALFKTRKDPLFIPVGCSSSIDKEFRNKSILSSCQTLDSKYLVVKCYPTKIRLAKRTLHFWFNLPGCRGRACRWTRGPSRSPQPRTRARDGWARHTRSCRQRSTGARGQSAGGKTRTCRYYSAYH